MAVTITYQFWSSDNNIDWVGPHTDIADVATSRYIKVKVNMASTEAGKVPTLEDMTVGYFKVSNILGNWVYHNYSEDEFTCPMCQEISNGVCVNIPAGEKDEVNGCDALHYRCDGNGNCTAPTETVSGACLNWGSTGSRSSCGVWCPANGYISCVQLWYYLWDETCTTFERTYPCSGEWSAADNGRSWKCRCVDYVYD